MTTTSERVRTARRRAKKQGLTLYKLRGRDRVAGLDLYILADENGAVFGSPPSIADLDDIEEYLKEGAAK